MSNNVLYITLVFGLLAVVGFVGDRLFKRTKIPDVLILLMAGVLIGPAFHMVDIRDLKVVTPIFSTLALVFIMFSGGLELNFDQTLRKSLPVLMLVALSMGTCIAGVGVALVQIWGWDWITATLLGTILCNTSGAIVLPVVNGLPIFEEDKTVLKLEAAVSDVFTILIFVTGMSVLEAMGTGQGATVDARTVLGRLTASFSIAIVLGIIAGTAWILVLNRISKIPHNYMATLGMVLVLYSVSEYLNASGMMSILFAGIVLANSAKFAHFFNFHEIQYKVADLRQLHTEFSFLLRTFFLVYIGLFLTKDMLAPRFLPMGLTIMAILVASRVVTAIVFKVTTRRTLAAAWATAAMLPRGLVVAALAIVPGQAVDDMIATRAARVAEHAKEIGRLQGEAARVLAEKNTARMDGDADRMANLAKDEVRISAGILDLQEKQKQMSEVSGTLAAIQQKTGQFTLFAPLSILVTNILMTLGCFMVIRAARKEATLQVPSEIFNATKVS